MSAKRAEKRADNRNSIIRVVVGSVLLGIQVWWLVFMILNLEGRFPWVSILVSLIAVMAAVTFLLRALPFLAFRKKTPEYVSYLGRVLPPAIIGMLVIYCL